MNSPNFKTKIGKTRLFSRHWSLWLVKSYLIGQRTTSLAKFLKIFHTRGKKYYFTRGEIEPNIKKLEKSRETQNYRLGGGDYNIGSYLDQSQSIHLDLDVDWEETM